MAQAVEFHHLANGVTNDARQAVIETQFLDGDGNPIDITGGGAPTTIPVGALVGGDGISAVRDKTSGVVTVSVAAKGITTGMLADGVIPEAYTLPAAGTALGGVKKGAAVAAMAVADPPAAADAPTKAEYDALLAYAKGLKATLNQLVSSLKASGAIA